MARDEERIERSQQEPIVGALPDVPGIVAAMRLTPGLGVHLRALADELLVNDYPGATISRAEREMLATAVSAGNDCFFCMDSHAAHATALLERSGETDLVPLLDELKLGALDGFDPKMRSLLHVARTVGRAPRELTADDVAAASTAGATDADVQLAVLIASAFSMYNRMVDGFRARTPASIGAYRSRALEIAEQRVRPAGGPAPQVEGTRQRDSSRSAGGDDHALVALLAAVDGPVHPRQPGFIATWAVLLLGLEGHPFGPMQVGDPVQGMVLGRGLPSRVDRGRHRAPPGASTP